MSSCACLIPVYYEFPHVFLRHVSAPPLRLFATDEYDVSIYDV